MHRGGRCRRRRVHLNRVASQLSGTDIMPEKLAQSPRRFPQVSALLVAPSLGLPTLLIQYWLRSELQFAAGCLLLRFRAPF